MDKKQIDEMLAEISKGYTPYEVEIETSLRRIYDNLYQELPTDELVEDVLEIIADDLFELYDE